MCILKIQWNVWKTIDGVSEDIQEYSASHMHTSSRHPSLSFSARADIQQIKKSIDLSQISYIIQQVSERCVKDPSRMHGVFTTRHWKKITSTYFLPMWPQMPLGCLKASCSVQEPISDEMVIYCIWIIIVKEYLSHSMPTGQEDIHSVQINM